MGATGRIYIISGGVYRRDMWSNVIEHSEQLTMTNVFVQPPESTKIWIKCLMFDLMLHFSTDCRL